MTRGSAKGLSLHLHSRLAQVWLQDNLNQSSHHPLVTSSKFQDRAKVRHPCSELAQAVASPNSSNHSNSSRWRLSMRLQPSNNRITNRVLSITSPMPLCRTQVFFLSQAPRSIFRHNKRLCSETQEDKVLVWRNNNSKQTSRIRREGSLKPSVCASLSEKEFWKARD